MEKRVINNKGFSLVELIVVIAIMAILVGVLAPNLLRYIGRADISADIQVADSIRSAVNNAMIDPMIPATDKPAVGNTTLSALKGAFGRDVAQSFNYSSMTGATSAMAGAGGGIYAEFRTGTPSSTSDIVITIEANQNVIVRVPNTKDANGAPIEVGRRE